MVEKLGRVSKKRINQSMHNDTECLHIYIDEYISYIPFSIFISFLTNSLVTTGSMFDVKKSKVPDK